MLPSFNMQITENRNQQPFKQNGILTRNKHLISLYIHQTMEYGFTSLYLKTGDALTEKVSI